MRDGGDFSYDSSRGIRRGKQKEELFPANSRFGRKKVTFALNGTGELRHSLAKRVPELDEENESGLYSFILSVEGLLVNITWATCLDKDWSVIKYLRTPGFGLVFYIQLKYEEIIQIEKILSALNSPVYRPCWDTDIHEISILEGHNILDSNVIMKKRGISEGISVTRYVRSYHDSVLLIERSVESLPRSNHFTCAFIWIGQNSTVIELIMPFNGEIHEGIRLKRLWGWKLYQEILSDSPSETI